MFPTIVSGLSLFGIAFALAAETRALGAEPGGIAIVPRPVEMKTAEGEFTITPRTQIIASAETTRIAAKIQNRTSTSI